MKRLATFLRALADRLDPQPVYETPLSDALRQEAIDNLFSAQFRTAALDIAYGDRPTTFSRKLLLIDTEDAQRGGL